MKTALAFNSNGNILACGHENGELSQYDLDLTPTPLMVAHTLPTRGPISKLQFSPDGRHIFGLAAGS